MKPVSRTSHTFIIPRIFRRTSFLGLLVLLPAVTNAQSFSSAAPQLQVLYEGFRTPEVRSDTVTLRFIGDVMLHRAQLENAARSDGEFDFSTFLEGIKPELESADLAVANMEFPLGGAPYTGYPCFCAPDAYAQYAADCGIDVFLTANNHILDRGQKGLERTLEVYERMRLSRGTQHTGCGAQVLMLPVHGIAVAIVNFTYGTNIGPSERDCVNRMEEETVGDMLRQAKENGADIIIACPHWGREYELTHSPQQERWAEFLAVNGADIIIGSHPHVVQDKSHIVCSDGREVPVYYSTGNAVSNMSAVNTQLEIMVNVRLLRGRDGSVSILEVNHDWLWCSRPGGICDSFMTVKTEGAFSSAETWRSRREYAKMQSAMERIAKHFGKAEAID